MSAAEAKYLRHLVREWQALMMTAMKRYQSCGMPQVRPEPPDAIKAASLRLAQLRKERQRAKRAAWSPEQKAAFNAAKKLSLAKRSDHYRQQREQWARDNSDKMRVYGRDYMRRRRQAARDEANRPDLKVEDFAGGGVFSGLYQAFSIGAKTGSSNSEWGGA